MEDTGKTICIPLLDLYAYWNERKEEMSEDKQTIIKIVYVIIFIVGYLAYYSNEEAKALIIEAGLPDAMFVIACAGASILLCVSLMAFTWLVIFMLRKMLDA